MKRGTIINNRIIKKEPQTQKLTERTNTDTLQDLSIPLQCGGKEFVSECNELTNSGGGQLCASHQNDYVTLNLFQGLANVAEGDDLKTQTAVNCDECQILKRVQNDEIGVVVPPPEPLNSRKFVKWFRPPLRRGHQANYDETISNTQEYRNNRKEQLQMKTVKQQETLKRVQGDDSTHPSSRSGLRAEART